MAYWLFKSEPETWSWDDQVAKGEAGEEWDGVRNYQARNNMREMKIGDLGFFYHSVKEKRIVGIVEVCATSHPDSTTDDARWDCVDIKAVAPVPEPVSLAEIKATEALADFALIKQSRLSVVPVDPAHWKLICKMAGYTGRGAA
ncbi:MAG: EVE domain-containing protein [Pseudomonadota bacterium]